MQGFQEQAIIEIRRIFTFYHFHFATGYVFPGERHPFWEMVYVLNGQVDIGADERVAVYNNNNATDLPEYDDEGNITNADDETLTELGTQRLLELQEESEIELFLEDQATACIGDSVGAQSVSTGISVTGTVNKLVLKIGSDGVPVISHEVGKLVEESEEEL